MADGTQTDIEVKFLPQLNIQRTDAFADRRRQRPLDGDFALLDRLQSLFGQPDSLAVNPGRLFSGKNFGPRNGAFALIRLFNGGIPDIHGGFGNIRANAVALNIGDQRMIRNIESAVGCNGDFISCGKFDFIVSHENAPLWLLDFAHVIIYTQFAQDESRKSVFLQKL